MRRFAFIGWTAVFAGGCDGEASAVDDASGDDSTVSDTTIAMDTLLARVLP